MNPQAPQQPPENPTEPPAYAPAPQPVNEFSVPPTVPQTDGAKSIVSTLALLLLAPLLAIFLTMFVFQSYEVDGPSMQTTLSNHDRLIVLKLPRTLARITHHAYLPDRGDIIIFNEPEATDPTTGASRQLIKRVVGLPGDHVVVKDGTLTIYNKEHPQGFSPDKTMSYGKVIVTTPGDVDLVVPDGQIFVCGDNRTNSFDSRYFGTVPLDNVIGKLDVRVYPFSQIKIF